MIPPSLALLAYPLFAIALFASQGVRRGVIYGGLIGYLFLPTSVIDLPGLPGITKDVVVGFSLLFGLYAAPDRDKSTFVSEAPNTTRLLWACIALFVIGAAATWLTNTKPIFNGGAALPGLGPRDFLSHMTPALSIVPTLLVARRQLASQDAHRDLCIAIVIMALVYSLFALAEIRLSPQLNRWVYGYFPHSWIQHFRAGGWRPIVFLDHGLSLGFFLTSAVLCCAAIVRSAANAKSGLWVFALVYLLGVLILSRNIGALGLCLLFLPMIFGLSQRLQLKVTVVVAWAYMLYPLIRSFGLLPYAWFLEFIRGYSPARHESFLTRFVNEDRILARAFEKPFAGWGRWSRSRIFDGFGNDITIADGLWVIRLGVDGILGFISMFGPLILAVFAISRLSKTVSLKPTTTVFALVTAANLIYLVPNSTLSPVAWLMAGGLLGFVEFGRRTAEGGATPPVRSPRDIQAGEAPRYSRFSPKSDTRTLHREH